MQARNIFVRISKLLGKAILGLLLLLIVVVALIHIPAIQRQITRNLANYLSSKIEARVEMQSVYFSILGNVEIENLQVWDRNNNKILSAGKIEVSSSLFNLISGDFIFDDIHLDGVSGQLIQGEEGLNIQFILDAFQPEKRATKSNAVTLQFKKVFLENIVFEFTSSVNGINLVTNLGTLTSEEAEFSTHPSKIRADKIYLQNTAVNILSTQAPDTIGNAATSKNNKLPSPDFGAGIIFEIKDLEFRNNDFSFHRNQVKNTPKFDPAHLELKNLQLNLSDLLMREDTLAASVHALSAQLPGFTLADAGAAIQLNRDRLALSKFHIASNTTELQADLKVWYDLKSPETGEHANVEIAAKGRVDPVDLAYFLSDSVMRYFSQWETTALELTGNYILGNGDLKSLKLKTGNSQLYAEGMFGEVWDPQKLYWKNMVIQASIGSAFRGTLTPFLKNINVPPDATLELKSSGDPKKIFADGKIFTTWGNAIATGSAIRLPNNVELDVNLSGEKVDVGKWMDLSWLGPVDLSVSAKGIVGDDQDVEIKGLINSIEILEQDIQEIDFQSRVKKTNATATLSIADPDYRSEMSAEIVFEGPLTITSNVQLDSFSLGRLLPLDSTLHISGGLKSKIKIDQPSLEGYVEGKGILFQNQSMAYLLDSMAFAAMMSPTASSFEYYTADEKGKLVSNFDIRDSRDVIRTWSENILRAGNRNNHPPGTKTLHLNLELENPSLLQLLGINVEDFSSLRITGDLEEQEQAFELHVTTGKFKGYGLSLDTLRTNLTALRDSVSGSIHAEDLFYKTFQLGNLDFDMVSKGDTAITNLVLVSDSTTTLGVGARILPTDSGTLIYPDKLQVFENDYSINRTNPVHIENGNIAFDHFQITRGDMQINLDGDLSAFDANLTNVDLTYLNYVLFPDSAVISKGHLTAVVSYVRDQQLQLKADIDSLSLYNSNPLTIAATATSHGKQVPFEFLLTNASNKIDFNGKYFLNNGEVDAALQVDVNNLELFAFLVSGVVDDMHGTLKGEATVRGPLLKPVLKGDLRLQDVAVTTARPKLTFNVADDIITLENSGLTFNDFTIHDDANNPLTLNGNITTKDYQSFAYDLRLNTDQFNLLNDPDSVNRKLRGLLVIATDIKLKGKDKDTNVDAEITIKDSTNLIFVTTNNDIELLKSEGIIDFIDPALLLDSTRREHSSDFYDSLIASLPDFNLNSTLKIEDNATVRVIIDEQSGDYIEASGGATLEVGYDRTGNLRLSGDYTFKQGVYRLSFYDLVKKNFQLVQGSSIKWSGSPEDGDLDIKAVHTVESNSIGLIGHEIGENEKSIYKRSLDYEIGINIKGTLEKPIISFSLDLPPNEKVNYPVLANKLDRLKLPEYGSELNKQVFGLLVLGGFLPESSGSDINSNLIATTALSNSVNSLLASQLNRFASQYVKGVSIDVGIQSYSDYSAPGGRTQTAMDFRVSKSILNDRLSFEIGGDFDINQDQSGANTGNKNYRGDIAIIYDLTGRGDKQLKLFNNETYDIIYQEIRNTGISLIFIREFAGHKEPKDKDK